MPKTLKKLAAQEREIPKLLFVLCYFKFALQYVAE
jgi:hypothetical protein